jgi:hypothetical protein
MHKPKTQSLHAALIALTLCFLSPFATAQEADYQKGLRERSQMFGDWGGARTALAQRGIIVDLQATQFYQSVTVNRHRTLTLYRRSKLTPLFCALRLSGVEVCSLWRNTGTADNRSRFNHGS